jgi:hypothetical protein
MLTIFSVPKAFEGHIDVIQRNAIHSWLRLVPPCQIILCGNDARVEDVAARLGVDWIGGIEHNKFGTPLLNDVFLRAEAHAIHDLLCFVNADIILLSDFLSAVQAVLPAKERFLMVGQRWDVDIAVPVAFDDPVWERKLRRRTETMGSLHPPMGSDYFVYPRGAIGPLPPFAVGRPSWDNWMIYHARKRHLPVIDATQRAFVVHQNHDYGHVPGGTGTMYDGPEGERNLELLGKTDRLFSKTDRLFTLAHATHRLTESGIAVQPRRSLSITRRLRIHVTLAPLPVQVVAAACLVPPRFARRVLRRLRRLAPLLGQPRTTRH